MCRVTNESLRRFYRRFKLDVRHVDKDDTVMSEETQLNKVCLSHANNLTWTDIHFRVCNISRDILAKLKCAIKRGQRGSILRRTVSMISRERLLTRRRGGGLSGVSRCISPNATKQTMHIIDVDHNANMYMYTKTYGVDLDSGIMLLLTHCNSC